MNVDRDDMDGSAALDSRGEPEHLIEMPRFPVGDDPDREGVADHEAAVYGRDRFFDLPAGLLMVDAKMPRMDTKSIGIEHAAISPAREGDSAVDQLSEL